jgi:hypothetical protein
MRRSLAAHKPASHCASGSGNGGSDDRANGGVCDFALGSGRFHKAVRW